MKLFLTMWAAALVAAAAILGLKAIPTTEAALPVAQSPLASSPKAENQRQGCMMFVQALQLGKLHCTQAMIAEVAQKAESQPLKCFFAGSRLHHRRFGKDDADLADDLALLATPTGDRIGVACFMIVNSLSEAAAERAFRNVKQTIAKYL